MRSWRGGGLQRKRQALTEPGNWMLRRNSVDDGLGLTANEGHEMSPYSDKYDKC